VDGTEPGFRSLSHWPGNTTPEALKHDLSTGIALRFARLGPEEQLRVLGSFESIANNHYDTDGVLCAFAVLHPQQALPREAALLDAAATGDFSTWHGPEALAVDLTVMAVSHHPRSPIADALAPGVPDAQRWALATDWLLEHLPAVLDDPFGYRELWAGQHAAVVADIERLATGTGVSVRDWPEDDLALVSSDRPMTAIGLRLAAGDRARVLLVRPSRTGFRYRFYERVESWFDLVSRPPRARKPLQPAVATLQRTDPAARGPTRWWCTDVQRPIAELGFGDPRRAQEVHFGDPDLEQDAETRVLPSAVIDALRASFRARDPHDPRDPG
jgi:hypothetical protein